MTREAMQQALEALEDFAHHGKAAGWVNAVTSLRAALAEPEPEYRVVGREGMSREAMQQALEFCEFLWREVAMNDYAEEKREATEAALRAALAEQDDDLTAAWMAGAAEERKRAEQAQPVAWMVYTLDGKSVYVTDNPTDLIGAYRALPLYTTPPVHDWTDADADAARLAMELEALLLSCKDTAAQSRWWDSAHDALELHRQRLAAAEIKHTESK